MTDSSGAMLLSDTVELLSPSATLLGAEYSAPDAITIPCD